MPNMDNYGELMYCTETDATFRIRDDGKMVSVFDASGDDFKVALRIEDVSAIMVDLHEHEANSVH